MASGFDRATALRFVAALALGWLTSWVVLSGGFTVLKALWFEYANAAPTKAYTLPMLFVRLIIFASMIAATATVSTLVMGDKRMAWLAGGLIVLASVPDHVYPAYVWDGYPAWYHIVYLLSILPIALLAGHLAGCFRPDAFDGVDP